MKLKIIKQEMWVLTNKSLLDPMLEWGPDIRAPELESGRVLGKVSPGGGNGIEVVSLKAKSSLKAPSPKEFA